MLGPFILLRPLHLPFWCVDPPPRSDVLSQISKRQFLGEGGFGLVYRARFRFLDIDVAVKVVGARSHAAAAADSSAHKLLQSIQESATMMGCGEDARAHIVRVFGVCIDPRQSFIVMELMKQSLMEKLHIHYQYEEVSPLPPPPPNWQVRRWALQVAQALLYLSHGMADQVIVHRDIKARNVLLDEKDHAFLSDFGLALVNPHSGEYTSPFPANDSHSLLLVCLFLPLLLLSS